MLESQELTCQLVKLYACRNVRMSESQKSKCGNDIRQAIGADIRHVFVAICSGQAVSADVILWQLTALGKATVQKAARMMCVCVLK